jgi:hypothetical protein
MTDMKLSWGQRYKMVEETKNRWHNEGFVSCNFAGFDADKQEQPPVV